MSSNLLADVLSKLAVPLPDPSTSWPWILTGTLDEALSTTGSKLSVDKSSFDGNFTLDAYPDKITVYKKEIDGVQGDYCLCVFLPNKQGYWALPICEVV